MVFGGLVGVGSTESDKNIFGIYFKTISFSKNENTGKITGMSRNIKF